MEQKEKQTNPAVIIIRKEKHQLPCKLTQGEYNAKSEELSTTTLAITAEEERQKSVKDQMKYQLSELTSKQTSLAHVVSRKEEYREVECTVELHSNDTVRIIRDDTGEIYSQRSAYDDEKQLRMPVES